MSMMLRVGEFSPRNSNLPESRHNPSPALARAIRLSRAELLSGPHSLISLRLSMASLALWRRGVEHSPWSGAEADVMMRAFHPGRLSRPWPGEPDYGPSRRRYSDAVCRLKVAQIRSGLPMHQFLARYVPVLSF